MMKKLVSTKTTCLSLTQQRETSPRGKPRGNKLFTLEHVVGSDSFPGSLLSQVLSITAIFFVLVYLAVLTCNKTMPFSGGKLSGTDWGRSA